MSTLDDETLALQALAKGTAELAAMARQLLAFKQQAATASLYGPIPGINHHWPAQGGVYAGIAAAEGDEPDGHLVLLDGVTPLALTWAEAIKHDFKLGDGARLPTRFESALLYANVCDRLDKRRAHWTSTQYSADGAFYQDFNGGCQDGDNKEAELRVVAVRRLAISPSILSASKGQ